MSATTVTCLALAWLAVCFAACRLPRLSVALVVIMVDLGLAGQVFDAIRADPLVVPVSGAALLAVLGTVVSSGPPLVSTPGPDGRRGRRGS
ncbi:MAG TPA: hypothetical protein VD860_15945 [Azospirillum sp.]|nr:hypothetical protein [Azospirillum sp.]